MKKQSPLKIYAAYGYKSYPTPFLEVLNAVLVNDISTADLVWFAGGEDISAELYGEVNGPWTSFNPRRDAAEALDYEYAVSHGIPMVGVCRGLQFLHAMHGGKLYQHVDWHTTGERGHLVQVISGIGEGEEFKVNSYHHQAAQYRSNDNDFAELLSVASVGGSKFPIGGDADTPAEHGYEVEAIAYPRTNSFAVQWHPEWMNFDSDAVQWFIRGIKTYCLNDRT